MIKKVLKGFIAAIKRKVLKLRHNVIGKKTVVCGGAYVLNSHIGPYSYIGIKSYLNHVEMGSYCSIAGFVIIGAMEHSHWTYSTSTYLSNEGYVNHPTIIGHDVWIGAQCVIRQGVKIGDGAVIGANSFVNKDIPPYAIAFGSPAKVYKIRFDEDIIKKLNDSRYWEKNPDEARQILEKLDSIEESNN